MPNMIRIRPQPFLAVVAALTLLPGCSAFNTHPIGTLGTAELSPTTNLTRDLLSLPAPRTPEGLPVGLQVIGRPHDEATILRLVANYEAAWPWFECPPVAAPAAPK